MKISNNKYYVTKYKYANGKNLKLPLQTTFDIDRLEDVRVRLIDKILTII